VRENASYYSVWDSSAKVSANTIGIFAQDQMTLTPRWSATTGIRLEDHEAFGKKMLGQVSSSYEIAPERTRLKANLSSGFKAPSLYQLYDPSYGNPSLKSETNESYDIGIEQQINSGRGALGVTYFHNRYANLIGFNDETYAYYNVSHATTYGVETTAALKLSARLKANFGYTYTHTADDSGEALLQHPGNIFTAGTQYRATNKLDINAEGRLVGERYDTDYPSQVTLPSYFVADLAATYKESQSLSGFIKISNLFNKHYEQVFSYRAPGKDIEIGGGFTF
jgi:vitamin B12 transporter